MKSSAEQGVIEKSRASGYTSGMKVAVSIPDPVFNEAERLAKRLKTSRSELYARALDRFVAAQAPDRVTEGLDAAIDAAGEAQPDDFSRDAARRVLARVEW
jgi:predicted transcriptional regulator